MLDLHINFATAHRMISSIVGENPDRIGAEGGTAEGSCCYIASQANYEPLRAVCIVGQFMENLGLLGLLVTGWTSEATKGYEAGVTNHSLRGTLSDYGLTFDDNAWEYLEAHQSFQDGRGNDLDPSGNHPSTRMPWGEAHEHALAYLRKMEERRLDEATRRLVLDSEVFNVLGRKGTTADGLADWERDLLNG